ncbi:hypothetical protein OC195_00850 [Priestia flexa]|nr:hypothetical protein OC195_00850 [Priestia flexa]
MSPGTNLYYHVQYYCFVLCMALLHETPNCKENTPEVSGRGKNEYFTNDSLYTLAPSHHNQRKLPRWARSWYQKIFIYDTFKKIPIPESDVIDVAKRDENLAAFLSFSPIYRWEVDEYSDHIEVRFIDLRYRSKDYYPFVAVVQLDYDLNIICSYTGWIFSEKKLRKKLDYLPH